MGGESGARFTDCRCLEMGCQEDGCEAEEGGQAGGISAAAFAVPVEDVDLGWLKVEAGIDLNHGAGPGEEGPAVTWGKGGGPDGSAICKTTTGGRGRVWGWGRRGAPAVEGLGKTCTGDKGWAQRPP